MEKNENNIYGAKFNYPFPYNLNKPSHAKFKKSKVSLASRPKLGEINEKTPEKLRLDSALKYLKNLELINERNKEKDEKYVKALKEIDLVSNFENISGIKKGEESKTDEDTSPADLEELYKEVGISQKKNERRFLLMKRNAFLFQAYIHLNMKNPNKALSAITKFKDQNKLGPKMNFEIQMILAEIYLEKDQPSDAMNCLRIDEIFEESKDRVIGSDASGNELTVENIVTGIREKDLPKRAIMFLNIATCNYFLDIPEEASDAISHALDSLNYNEEEEKATGRKIKYHEIPGFLAFSLIYMSLHKGDTETALKIIRKRRYDRTADNLLDMSTSSEPLRIN